MMKMNYSGFNENVPVVREFDGTFVVWIANGNQYVRLEEPAFFVFQNFEKCMNHELTVSQFTERYRISELESRQFVTEIVNGFEAIKQVPICEKSDCIEYGKEESQSSSFSVHNYSIRGKLVQFHYGTQLYENFLHPLLQHLGTGNSLLEPCIFELFGYNNQIVLKVNGKVKGIWGEEETHLLKGMAFLQILNVAYDKSDDDWMAVIHASAVTNGLKTIVFTASPGSGKSTIAALLQQKGYALVSDDFVPIEQFSQQVFPFPAAMSVKEGATALLSAFYPELQETCDQQQTMNSKSVRYLPVEGKAPPAPVKEIIFIKYDPAVDFELEKLTRIDALQMLLDEAWTALGPENASRFLDWYSGVFCYRLTYSNNQKALDAITNLFDHD